jgi:hypothetical protein
MRNVIIAGFLASLLYFCTVRESLGIEPFDNIAAPEGSYLLLYPSFSRADRLKDRNGNVLPPNPDATTYQNLFKYTYVDKTWLHNTSLISVFVPVGYIEMLGDRNFGIGDLSLVGGYWFIDDPVSKTCFGGKVLTVVPIGSYSKDRKANMGGNVWKFQPILISAKQMGRIQAELAAKYTIYTKNADTGVRQGNDVSVEAYCGYYLWPSLLAGGHLNGTFGWDKTVNGSAVRDSGVQKWQAGVSVFKRFGGFSAVVEALSDFGVKNSTEGFTVLLRLCWKL